MAIVMIRAINLCLNFSDIYMMVVGELLDIQPHPLVKAIKTQDLSDQSQAQAIWPLEVQDLEKFLTSQQQ